jgi:hypothetical protein
LSHHLGAFPGSGGAACATSRLSEVPDTEDLTPTFAALSSKTIQMFAYGTYTIVSVVELDDRLRLVVRDLVGKHVWDMSEVTENVGEEMRTPFGLVAANLSSATAPTANPFPATNAADLVIGATSAALPKEVHVGTADSLESLVAYYDQASRETGVGKPLLEMVAPENRPRPGSDGAQLRDSSPSDMMERVEVKPHRGVHGSAETEDVDESLPPSPNVSGSNISFASAAAPPPPPNVSDDAAYASDASIQFVPLLPTPPSVNVALAQRFLRQVGMSSWGANLTLTPLPKTEKLARNLRNLDTAGTSRERHKIGVVFVSPEICDKESVLGATHGSAAFEAFADELGWSVDLATHKGYTGLGKFTKSFDGRLPYFATASLEVCFHVASRLNPIGSAAGEKLSIQRFRHVGNDSVVIVWCEGGSTSTDVGGTTIDGCGGKYDFDPFQAMPSKVISVFIVIHPLASEMFRVQIVWKKRAASGGGGGDGGGGGGGASASATATATSPSTTTAAADVRAEASGPLFDGAIVDRKSLAILIRATAVNSGRVLRCEEGLARGYEMRAKYIGQITTQQEKQGFEESASSIIAGGEGNTSAARRRAKELRSSGKLKVLKRSVSSECLDKMSGEAARIPVRSLSQDNINAAGRADCDSPAEGVATTM